MAASGDPLITHGGSRSSPWKAALSMLTVTANSATAARLSIAGMSHRLVRSASSRQSDSAASPRRVLRIAWSSSVCHMPTRLPGSPATRIAAAGAPSAMARPRRRPTRGSAQLTMRSPIGPRMSMGK